MQLGLIGLGRMGANMAQRWLAAGHECVVYARNLEAGEALRGAGAVPTTSVEELVRHLAPPRTVWIMIPAAAVDDVIAELTPLLAAGDTIIDGGNSRYQHDVRRAATLEKHGIDYVDVGVSGGVFGLEHGYCQMIGGRADVVARLEPLFAALAPGGMAPRGVSTAPYGYLYCGSSGAGHFVKMVHNGIEYGLMAAYAEGFNLLRHANAGQLDRDVDAETAPLERPDLLRYDFDVAAIAELWRHGSVVRSWLLDLTAQALSRDGSLEGFSGHVADSGEGRWTVDAAIAAAVPVPVLASALFARFSSRGEDDFANRLLSAMRLEFGGHIERAAAPREAGES